VAVGLAIIAVVAPLVLATLIDPARAGGRALWEWSAAGGPTVQASYRFDGIAAIGVAVGAAYAAAGLFGAARASRRHPLLPAAIRDARGDPPRIDRRGALRGPLSVHPVALPRAASRARARAPPRGDHDARGSRRLAAPAPFARRDPRRLDAHPAPRDRYPMA